MEINNLEKTSNPVLTNTDSTPEAKDPKRILKLVLRIALTVSIFVVLFWQVHWIDVMHAIQRLDGWTIFQTCLLWIPTQYFQFLRWDILARQAGPNVLRRDIHRGYWVGYTLGLITPGRIGEYGRGLALHNCSLTRALGLTVVERNYSTFSLTGFGLLALVFLPVLGWIPPFPLLATTGDVLCIAGGVFFMIMGIFPRCVLPPLRWIARKLPWREKIEQALSVLEPIGPGQGTVLMTLATLALATSLLQFVILLHGMGSPVPVFAGMLAVLLNFFFKANLPISIGSLGVGEWTAILCLKGLGVPSSTAVAASLTLFTLNVFIPSLIGLPFISKLRVPHRQKASESVK